MFSHAQGPCSAAIIPEVTPPPIFILIRPIHVSKYDDLENPCSAAASKMHLVQDQLNCWQQDPWRYCGPSQNLTRSLSWIRPQRALALRNLQGTPQHGPPTSQVCTALTRDTRADLTRSLHPQCDVHATKKLARHTATRATHFAGLHSPHTRHPRQSDALSAPTM